MHRWSLQIDGVATFTKNSVAYLRKFGHHVHILTSIPGPTPLFGCDITRLPGVVRYTAVFSMC